MKARELLHLLVKVGKSPWVQLGLGLVLVICASAEVINDMDSAIGAEHGVLVYGIVQSVKALFEVLEGFVKVGEGAIEIENIGK